MKSIITDTRAVSPIVATLLLIVVVASAASFIAVLVGGFGRDTAEVNIKDVGEAAAIQISIIGTDLVEPLTEVLGESYAERNCGVKITTNGGDTTTGVRAVGVRVADIAAADREITLDELTEYPTLESYQIGNGVIVVISNPQQDFKKDTLRGLYNGTNTTLRAYHYATDSGIEERFCEYLNETTIPESNKNTTDSFELMVETVQNTDDSVGFVPFGYVMTGSIVDYIAGIENDAGDIITAENITLKKLTEAVHENESLYPAELRPPIYYVTNGNPATMCDAFIKWVRSPEGQLILREEGYVSLY